MDKKKSPGIAFKKLHLLECAVGGVNAEAELRFKVGITELKRSVSEDGSTLQVTIGFDLMQGIENPPCRFTCSYVAIYKRPSDANMTWEEFGDHFAVAHILPFLREFVCNVTMRLPISALMLAPLNSSRLVEDFQQRPKVMAPQGETA